MQSSKHFIPPQGQIVCVTGFRNGNQSDITYIITQNKRSGDFILYVPDEQGQFQKIATNKCPYFKECDAL